MRQSNVNIKHVRAAIVAVIGASAICGLLGYRMGLQARHAPNEDQVRDVLYRACANARGYDAGASPGALNRCNRQKVDMVLSAAYGDVYEVPKDEVAYEAVLDQYKASIPHGRP